MTLLRVRRRGVKTSRLPAFIFPVGRSKYQRRGEWAASLFNHREQNAETVRTNGRELKTQDS